MLNHVNNKKLSLIKLVELISTNPSKIYKIKNKGQIKKGYDADITIVNMKKRFTIKNDRIASKSKWSPFNGMNIKGTPVVTIVNGKIKMYMGKIIGKNNGKVVNFG